MRIGIIGLGVIGPLHARSLAEQGREIVALCDIDASRAESVKEKYAPYAEIYTDYLAMLDRASLDAVHICTPHYLHAEMAIAALERNINVLCEKPLCISFSDIDRIIEAEEGSKATLGVCLQNRYNPANMFAKNYIADKTLDSASARVIWHRDNAYYLSGEWRGKWATEGGGVLINQAHHTLDLLLWFCGYPDALTADCRNEIHREVSEVEDAADAELYGAVPCKLTATLNNPVDTPVEIEFNIRDHGILKVRGKRVTLNGETVFEADEKGEYFGKKCYGKSHGTLIFDFYDCLENKTHFMIDAREGAKVVKTALSCYESHGKLTEVRK